jgi:transcriptional regulator with XRE-family HTH domain
MHDNRLLTPELCKAARMFLGWTQADLAKYSGASLTAITSFECGSRNSGPGTFSLIVHAFQKEGVSFSYSEDDNEQVLGVKIRHTFKSDD